MRPLTRYVSSVIIFTPLLLLVARSEPPANLPTFPWLAFSVSSWWMPDPYLWTALDSVFLEARTRAWTSSFPSEKSSL